MSMYDAMKETEKAAKETNKLYYLYGNENGFWYSFVRWDDWLFRCYPGGRKELSMKGNDLLKKLSR